MRLVFRRLHRPWLAALIGIGVLSQSILSSVAVAQLNGQNNQGNQSNGSSAASDPFASYFDLSQSEQIQQGAAGSRVNPGSGQAGAPHQPTTISPSALSSQAAAAAKASDAAEIERARTIAQSNPRNPDEFETYVSDVAGQPLRRFGTNLLVPGARGFTVPPLTTIPADYRINPGDQLIVGLTGSVQAADIPLTVDANGQIFLPRIGAVIVGGVRYGDVKSVLTREISRVYRNFDVSVSIGQLHGITVYVTGFAATPGSYTVTSLSTLVNAVLAAGGPASGGSFRSIQLRREGRLISDFDLYDLLLKGDKSGDLVLQNGDVIYVAPVGPQVAVIGSVNHQAIFEAGTNETLEDVLLYAGGVNTVADNKRVMLLDPLREAGSGWEELRASDVRTRLVKRGEIMRVLSGVGIAHSVGEQPVLVTINGEVAKPGRYYFQPGARIEDVVAKAGGLTADAFPFATVFTRQSVRQQQQISYDRAIDDTVSALTIEPLTSATERSISTQDHLALVSRLVAEMRARSPEGRIVLDLPVTARSIPGDIRLENNDTIYIPPEPVVVGVFGAVPSPATFRYEREVTIGNYVKRAGGVRKFGDKGDIFVVRANGMVLAPRRGMFGGSILKEPALPGDLIFVPVDASRGSFWASLNKIFQLLLTTAVPVATVYSLTK